MSWRSAAAAVGAALGGLVVGVQLALLSGLVELHGFASVLAQTTTQKATLSAAYLAGAVACALPAGPTIDAHGRRRALLASGAITLVAAQVAATATRFSVFLATRFCAGAAYAFINIASPMYLSEVAPTELRGFYVALYQLAITIGIFGAQAANVQAALRAQSDLLSFRAPLRLALVPSALMLVCVYAFAPETPAWLRSRGRVAEAVASQVALSMPADDDIDAVDDSHAHTADAAVHADVEAPAKSASRRDSGEVLVPAGSAAPHSGEGPGFGRLFWDAGARRSLTIAVGIQVGQQLTGINCVVFFAPTILKPLMRDSGAAAGFIAAAAVGLFNMVSTVFSLAVVERFGRKTLIAATSWPMVFALVALAGGARDMVAVAAVVVYIGAFAVGWGPVPFLVSSEVFPIGIRGAGMTVSSLVMSVAGLGVISSFLHLHGLLGQSVFGLYALLTAASAGFVHVGVPETRNVPMARIAALLNK